MYLTLEKLEKYTLNSGSNYWKEGFKYRWKYMSYAIEQMKKLAPEEEFRFCEIGCSGIPLHPFSDQLNYPEIDINNIPYHFPKISGHTGIIPDKFYDITIALQVWEHLDKQAEAFKEVERISKAAILSFPYQWKHGNARHQGIDDNKIAEWTCQKKPIDIKQIGTRIVYTWEF